MPRKRGPKTKIKPWRAMRTQWEREAEIARVCETYATRVDNSADTARSELGPCQLWNGSVRDGYAVINNSPVHRTILELRMGRRLKGRECVLHTCDRRNCIEPWHLMIGDRRVNAWQRDERGRTANGQWNATAKLTDEQADLVRDLYEIRFLNGRVFDQYLLARMFNVCQPAISRIVNGQRYKVEERERRSPELFPSEGRALGERTAIAPGVGVYEA